MKVSINGGTPNPLVNGYFLYQHFSPQLCVGFLFLILYPGSPPPRLLHTQLCHTPSFTYNFVNHHLSHPIFHTQLCQPPSVTHHLSHTTLSTTIFHTQLCHTPSFTYNFVNHHLSHTTLSHTIFHIQLCQPPSFTHTTLSHTPSFTYNFVNHYLGDIYLRLVWQAGRLVTSTFVLRGRRGTYGTGWRAWVGFSRR